MHRIKQSWRIFKAVLFVVWMRYYVRATTGQLMDTKLTIEGMVVHWPKDERRPNILILMEEKQDDAN